MPDAGPPQYVLVWPEAVRQCRPSYPCAVEGGKDCGWNTNTDSDTMDSDEKKSNALEITTARHY